MKLTKDEKAQAIQFAMDLEQERFNQYAVKAFLKLITKEEKQALYKFWRTSCALTQKAYAECCLQEETNIVEDDIFSMTLKEKFCAFIICILFYFFLVALCIALGGIG